MGMRALQWAEIKKSTQNGTDCLYLALILLNIIIQRPQGSGTQQHTAAIYKMI